MHAFVVKLVDSLNFWPIKDSISSGSAWPMCHCAMTHGPRLSDDIKCALASGTSAKRKQPLYTLEQSKFGTRFQHIIFGQGSAQRKCFDLEALANLRFSRGTGGTLNSE